MTPLLFLGIAVAGCIGAGLRHLVDAGLTRAMGERFPWGIIVVNVSGSLALGIVVGCLPGTASLLIGAGLLGGYTTFSTAMLDALELWQDGRRSAAAGALLGTLVCAVLASIAGLAIGQAIV